MEEQVQGLTEFSIVMPFRDTPRERKFAERSIPSAISLNPDEFVIGIDKPADQSFLDLIHDLCRQHDFGNYKILQVPRSEKWGFQLANIIWHCYETCKHDRILSFDVDSVLRPAVMQGIKLVGQDNNVVVSFTKKLLIKNIGDLVRYVNYRLRVRRSSFVFSGVYWIYRPYYYEATDQRTIMSISNGIDGYMVDKVQKLNRHLILTLKDIGVDCLDYQNEDYPWRQFQYGIWAYANHTLFSSHTRHDNTHDSLLIRMTNRTLILRHTFKILLRSILKAHPWFFRGWVWALRNPEHEAVLQASNSSVNTWFMHGSKYIKDIRNWEKHGRLGTGFG